jgi:hypothetical protein
MVAVAHADLPTDLRAVRAAATRCHLATTVHRGPRCARDQAGRRESCGLWRVPTPSRETRDASHPRPLPADRGGAERVAPKGDTKRRNRDGNDEGSRCADRDRSDRHQRNMPRRRQRRDVLPPGRVHGHMIPRRRSAATPWLTSSCRQGVLQPGRGHRRTIPRPASQQSVVSRCLDTEAWTVAPRG